MGASRLSFFITPQTGPPFNVTAEDTTVPAGEAWTFGDLTLNFADNKRFIVNGDFNAIGTTFTRNTTWTWWGMDLDAASVDTLRDIYFDGDSLHVHTNSLVLDGYNTVYGTGILIPEGVTLTIPTGVTLKLAGTQANPSQIIVHGTLNVDGYIACSTASEVIADGGTVNGKGNIEMGCINACMLARNGGTLRFFAGSTTTVGSSAFLANESGTFILEDNATITYEASAKPLLVSPGTTFRLGQNAKIILKKPVTLSGSTSQPIYFLPLTTGLAWNQIKVEATAAGSSFDYVEAQGATYGLGILADNVSVTHSSFSDNDAGILVQGGNGVTLTDNTINGSSSNGVNVIGGATATLTGNTLDSNNDGVSVNDTGTQAVIGTSEAGNTITNSTYAGVRLQNEAVATVTDNEINYSGTHGIVVKLGAVATSITENGLLGNTGAGVAVVSGAQAPLIRENVIIGNNFGIQIKDAGTSATVEANNPIAQEAPVEALLRRYRQAFTKPQMGMTAGEGSQTAGEVAMLIEVEELIREGDYEAALGQALTYEADIWNGDNRVALFELESILYQRLAAYVATLVDAPYRADRHEARFDGSMLPSGRYLVRAVPTSEAETYRFTRLLLLMK